MSEEKISIHELLHTKFPAREYALVYEVRDDAGFNANRSADAIAVNLWPSRGHSITGFEIKVSRSDWLSELKNPKKAEAIMKYCDYWYLVVENESIIKEEELPATWGCFVRKGNRLSCIKKAPTLTPEPLSVGFVAAMMKRATQGNGMIPVSEIEDRINSAKDNARKEGERSGKNKIEDYQRDLDRIRKKMDDFKKESGVDLDDWAMRNLPEVGKAVRFILDGGMENLKKEMQRISNIHKTQHETIEQIIIKL